jgi:hypothetical protein
MKEEILIDVNMPATPLIGKEHRHAHHERKLGKLRPDLKRQINWIAAHPERVKKIKIDFY